MTEPDRVPSDEIAGDEPGARIGRAIFWTSTFAFVAIATPLVWRGAPLADDFNNCMAPVELGLGGFLKVSWHQLGAIRPARFLEILITGSICRSLPFGVAILVSLLLTVAVAFLARSVLRDLGTSAFWANVGGALWLLQPLGTEAGLWPAALHVPLGLALSLVAVRLYRRDRVGWGTIANLGATLSVEQAIFALPLVAWLVAPAGERRRAAAASAAVAVGVVGSAMLWPGANQRLKIGIVERISGLAADPSFYVGFPAVGMGLHSIPLAVWWARPWSVVLLALGAVAGWTIGPHLIAAHRTVRHRELLQGVMAFTAILLLANVVVVLTVPHQGSPRVFAPSWLVLALGAGVGGAALHSRRPRLLGTTGGLFAAGALLSLMFSVWVRLQSADFTERAADIVAARVPEAGRVAVCQVRRTVVEPAPRGAFAVHDFISDWAAEGALLYYTGRHATIFLSGDLWDQPCPHVPDVDAVIDFNELVDGEGR
jgi:hypothetical protein